ncbi:ADP-ribose pyrophosphatase [Aliidongia dinghuensis]|uniref:GDP-mannose pyrophosphatase n=1 Tax=Aliidongia dinghuensis TaxID=1867774 RepID=A0A8J2YRU7_9PROT|nr:NUDIX domain-containing protein [Aliidongia dinghuensis]GGF13482.1 ADP-ribose pyrophosphatase [Aliidongia dinghuensis]
MDDAGRLRAEGYTLLAHDRCHDGFLKLDRYQVRHRRFDGTTTPVLDREIVVGADCVGVLLYDPVHDAVVLIEQFRLPAAVTGEDAIQVEIVAGRIDPGEPPLAAVEREVREETGCVILGAPERIAVALISPGYNTERLHLYCAIVDAGAAGGLHGLATEDEDIRVLVQPYDTFAAWQTDGRIANLFTLHAGLWLALNRDRLRSGA